MGTLLRTILMLLLVGAGWSGASKEATAVVDPLPAAPPLREPVLHYATTIQLQAIAPGGSMEGTLAPPDTVQIAGPSLSLYEGPSAAFPVVASVPQGEILPVRAALAGGEWLEVEWEGRRGWLATAALHDR